MFVLSGSTLLVCLCCIVVSEERYLHKGTFGTLPFFQKRSESKLPFYQRDAKFDFKKGIEATLRFLDNEGFNSQFLRDVNSKDFLQESNEKLPFYQRDVFSSLPFYQRKEIIDKLRREVKDALPFFQRDIQSKRKLPFFQRDATAKLPFFQREASDAAKDSSLQAHEEVPYFQRDLSKSRKEDGSHWYNNRWGKEDESSLSETKHNKKKSVMSENKITKRLSKRSVVGTVESNTDKI